MWSGVDHRNGTIEQRQGVVRLAVQIRRLRLTSEFAGFSESRRRLVDLWCGHVDSEWVSVESISILGAASRGECVAGEVIRVEFRE